VPSSIFWNSVRLLRAGWLILITGVGLAEGLQPLPVLASQVSHHTRSPLVQKCTHTLALDRQLCQAAQVGDLMRVKNLAAHGACINAAQQNGWTALMLAADGRHLPVVEFLLNHGADVHRRSIAYNDVDALMLAAQAGSAAICRLLLERGVDVNETDINGDTVLMYTVGNTNISPARVYQTTKYLLSRGAKVQVKDKLGNTPLSVVQAAMQLEPKLAFTLRLLKCALAAK